MNKVSFFLFYLVSWFFLFSCKGKPTVKTQAEKQFTNIELSEAKLFAIAKADEYTQVTVYNPWKQGEIYDTYYLIKQEDTEVPSDGHKVRIPISSLMVNSATHLGFLELLGELDKVTGVCDANYIYSPVIRQGVNSGQIQNLGDAFNLDIERLLMLRPQAVMTTAYNAEDENSRRMKQTGLTLLYNIEWQEKTLLGRAEWIKFVGAFFDKLPQADSIYTHIETEYNKVKELAAQQITDKPTVLSGQDFRGSWSMPGGKSFNAILFQDAGADYYYKNNESSGSISTSIEEALLHFSKADIWVNVQVNTLQELARMDSKYKLFKPYQTGFVYNNLRRTNETGGNDYWESGVARPDLLLRDMMKIFHPDLQPGYELTYMQKLK
ncbi:MAG: ABC transporter substrate-binding protein [Bacteroides sp.]|nr:ABC transporter substrate-binding protein [Bacteroides sp.]